MHTYSINLDIVPDIFCNSQGRPSPFKLLIFKTIMQLCERILFGPDLLEDGYRPLDHYRFFHGCYHMLKACLKLCARIIYYVCKYLLKKMKPTDEAYQAYVAETARQIFEHNKTEDIFKILNSKASLGWTHDVTVAQRALIRELFNLCTHQYLTVARPEPVAMLRFGYYSVWGGNNSRQAGNNRYQQYTEKMKAIDAYATSVITKVLVFIDPQDVRDYDVQIRDIPKYSITPPAVERILYDPMMCALAQFCIDDPIYRDLAKGKELLSYLPEDHQGQLIKAIEKYSSPCEATEGFHRFENQLKAYHQCFNASIKDDQVSADAVIRACQQIDQKRGSIYAERIGSM